MTNTPTYPLVLRDELVEAGNLTRLQVVQEFQQAGYHWRYRYADGTSRRSCGCFYLDSVDETLEQLAARTFAAGLQWRAEIMARVNQYLRTAELAAK